MRGLNNFQLHAPFLLEHIRFFFVPWLLFPIIGVPVLQTMEPSVLFPIG
jgi:hypothetical protein